MSVDRILQLKLIGDVGSLNKDLTKTQGRLTKLGGAAKSWGKAFAFSMVIEGIEAVTNAIGDAWEGFRAGQAVEAQLANTFENLGLSGTELAASIDAVSASTRALGTDDNEAIQFLNDATIQTGDAAKSMEWLAIAQDLVANGSAPDLTAALRIIQGAAKGSGKVVDKFGLDADTAGGRVAQLGRKVGGAAKKAAELNPLGVLFNALNEDLEGIVGSFATGDFEGGLTSLKQMGTDLATAWESVWPAVQKFIQDVDWQALFDDAVTALKDLGPKLIEGMTKLVGTISEGIMQAFREADWPALWDELVAMLTDVLPKIADAIANIGRGIVDGIVTFVTTADWQLLWDEFVNMLVDVLPKIADGILNIGKAIVDGVVDFVTTYDWGALLDGLITFLKGVPASVLKVGKDIGGKLVDGIVQLVRGLPGKVRNLIVQAINAIIGAWNQLDIRIPAFNFDVIPKGEILGHKWDAWGVNFAGTGDLIPNIDPIKMAKGGIVTAPTLAMIGEGRHDEAVIPLDGRHGMTGNTTYNITINASPLASPADIGRKVVESVQAFERRNGAAWRS